MRNILPKGLLVLAKNCPTALYVVGGSVRDYLAHLQPNKRDWDICSPLPAEEFASVAEKNGFQIRAVYRNTGTVKIIDGDGTDYEYSCFRSDKYVRGLHVPAEIFFTDDIRLDALRRDFTANAVYYHVQADTYVDPLNGISAIQEKRLTTVASAEKVFGEDGLRLMRMARQAAQLGFTPDSACLAGARKNASLIQDISPERIFTELCAILSADKKYGVPNAHYHGLRLLQESGVLHFILPELAQGEGLTQRADFHKYDVLEHSLRTVLYADESIRLAALLHDVGKPYCMQKDGNAHAHHEEGERLAREILHRLKAPKKTTERVCELVKWHMYDLNCQTKETKLRRFFVAHHALLDELLLLKQADFSACMDDTSLAPTCARWQALLGHMKEEKTPFSLKELAVNGRDLLAVGLPAERLSDILEGLLLHTAVHPQDNEKQRLQKLAKSLYR